MCAKLISKHQLVPHVEYPGGLQLGLQYSIATLILVGLSSIARPDRFIVGTHRVDPRHKGTPSNHNNQNNGQNQNKRKNSETPLDLAQLQAKLLLCLV